MKEKTTYTIKHPCNYCMDCVIDINNPQPYKCNKNGHRAGIKEELFTNCPEKEKHRLIRYIVVPQYIGGKLREDMGYDIIDEWTDGVFKEIVKFGLNEKKLQTDCDKLNNGDYVKLIPAENRSKRLIHPVFFEKEETS